MAATLDALDHLVLTVSDLDATTAFYSQVLGMKVEQFRSPDGTVRTALKFGRQKINLHRAGAEFEPKARIPTKGSADLCFLSQTTLDDWMRHLADAGVAIKTGPIERTGATGPLLSIYLRDPDGNLIEVSNLV